MKHFLLTIAILIAASSFLNAQNNIEDDDFDDKIIFGIIYGINYSYVENYGNNGFRGERAGYNAGLIAEMPFAKNWSFEASVFFATEGEQPIVDGERVARFRMYTINVPVQFKYYIAGGFSAHIGPQISYIFSPKIFENRNQEFRVLDDVVHTGFAGTAGFGYQFPNFGLFIKTELSYGFSDIFVNNDIYESERLKVVRFSLGYKF
jgi:hypothetical protein